MNTNPQMMNRRQATATEAAAITAFSAGCSDLIPSDGEDDPANASEEMIEIQDNFDECEIHEIEILSEGVLGTALRMDIENKLDENLQFVSEASFYSEDGTLLGEDDPNYNHGDDDVNEAGETERRNTVSISGDHVENIETVELELYRMYYPDDKIEVINHTDYISLEEVEADYSTVAGMEYRFSVSASTDDGEFLDDTVPVTIEITNANGEVFTRTEQFGGRTTSLSYAGYTLRDSAGLLVIEDAVITLGEE